LSFESTNSGLLYKLPNQLLQCNQATIIIQCLLDLLPRHDCFSDG